MDKKILEELTLYLDGEHPEPAAFEAKMGQDSELAQRCHEYQTLSQGLRALEAPDMHPAFATRVLANVEKMPAPEWADVLRAWQRAMLAPALLLIFGLGLWWIQPTVETPAPPQVVSGADVHTLVASTAKWNDDEAVIGELMALMAQGVDASTLVPYDGTSWYQPTDEDMDTLFGGGIPDWDVEESFYSGDGIYGAYWEIEGENLEEIAPFLLENTHQ